MFETFQIWKRLSQSLAAHDTNLYLSHIEPTPMFWRVAPLKAFR